jgi:hypothetical protein
MADGNVRLERRETGRTHTVTGQGVDLLRDPDGNPEAEYVLLATIDGVDVVLSRWAAGTIEIRVAAAQAAADAEAEQQRQSDAQTAGQSTTQTTGQTGQTAGQ